MILRKITLLRIKNVEIRIHTSWLLIVLSGTWFLARGIYPYYYRSLGEKTYWWMAVVAMVVFIVSLLFHELGHLAASQNTRLPINIVTLYIFGGVFQSKEEAKSVREEILVACAGPLCSAFLSCCAHTLFIIGKAKRWPLEILGVCDFGRMVNLLIALFNLIPAYPLDGGRIVRAFLWRVHRDIRWATNCTATIGIVFGTLLMSCGLILLLRGRIIGGVWLLITGLFMQNASRFSYQRFWLRDEFEGEPVRAFMTKDPVQVPSYISLAEFMGNYQLQFHFKLFPVESENNLIDRCISVRNVMEIPQLEWKMHTVGDVAVPFTGENCVYVDTDVMSVFSRMYLTGNSRMMVVDSDKKCVGIVVLRDLLKFLKRTLCLQE